MAIKVYKAPDCLRCKITKAFMDERNMVYEAFDFKAEKDIVNTFYRTNRARLYRNPEGVEFPMYHDEEQDVIKQGTGEIIAFLLSGHALETCVTRSDLLHGWISGLYVSQCPDAQEENFLTLVRHLSKGGLEVFLQSDGRKPELLEKILAENLVTKLVLNIPGPAELYPDAVGGSAPSKEELAKSIALTRAHKNHVIRLLLKPITPKEGAAYYISPAQAAEAAKMVFEACGDVSLPFGIQIAEEIVPGLEALEESALLPYRGKVRNSLVKADIIKNEAQH